MLPCEKPKATASQQRAREFSINNSGVADSYQLTQLGWVVASTLSRMKDERSSQIPGWAGYNSLVSTSKPLTEVGALPLLPEVALWSGSSFTASRRLWYDVNLGCNTKGSASF